MCSTDLNYSSNCDNVWPAPAAQLPTNTCIRLHKNGQQTSACRLRLGEEEDDAERKHGVSSMQIYRLITQLPTFHLLFQIPTIKISISKFGLGSALTSAEDDYACLFRTRWKSCVVGVVKKRIFHF